jgi:uncharacterized protein
MRILFADAGYWIALINPADDLHQRARAISSTLTSAKVVTSEMVFNEVLNAFSKRNAPFRTATVRLIQSLRSDSTIEVVPQTSELFQAALTLYEQRPDQGWSHTDCASFHIMQQRSIHEALAHDKHFEQAGFIALLR